MSVIWGIDKNGQFDFDPMVFTPGFLGDLGLGKNIAWNVPGQKSQGQPNPKNSSLGTMVKGTEIQLPWTKILAENSSFTECRV